MKLLLDTHVWVWRLLDPARLSSVADEAIEDDEAELFLSPVSVWETLVLARKGRLALRPSPQEWVRRALRRSRPTPVPITHAVAIGSETLDGFGSDDPADRFLVATAIEHNLTMVTADAVMHGYGPLSTLW